jgi:hypothetical protein
MFTVGPTPRVGRHRRRSYQRPRLMRRGQKGKRRNQAERGKTRRAQGMSKRHGEPEQGYDQLALSYRVLDPLGIHIRGAGEIVTRMGEDAMRLRALFAPSSPPVIRQNDGNAQTYFVILRKASRSKTTIATPTPKSSIKKPPI